MVRINTWSGPRNISTALMYSFAQRSDTRVVDEPFYAHYLLQSGAEHPGRAEVLESQPRDASVVIENLLRISTGKSVLYLKNMAHHMVAMGETLKTLLDEFQHVFLIRDPAEMLPSLAKRLPNPTLRDTAYRRQFELFEMVKASNGPLNVIDSAELLKDPETVLQTLCSRLQIPFYPEMLSWEAGPIPEDGIWAKHWYHNVHQSTGFKPYRPRKRALPEHLIPLYEACKSFYQQMFVHAIKVNA